MEWAIHPRGFTLQPSLMRYSEVQFYCHSRCLDSCHLVVP
jgi:hypothetical protein